MANLTSRHDFTWNSITYELQNLIIERLGGKMAAKISDLGTGNAPLLGAIASTILPKSYDLSEEKRLIVVEMMFPEIWPPIQPAFCTFCGRCCKVEETWVEEEVQMVEEAVPVEIDPDEAGFSVTLNKEESELPSLMKYSFISTAIKAIREGNVSLCLDILGMQTEEIESLSKADISFNIYLNSKNKFNDGEIYMLLTKLHALT